MAFSNIFSVFFFLTEEVKNHYNENFIFLKKEIEEDTRRWKDLLSSWIGRINIVKITILLKAIYRFNEIPIKMIEIEKHKAHMKYKRPWNSAGVLISYIKLYYFLLL